MVVGTGIEARDLVHLAPTCRQSYVKELGTGRAAYGLGQAVTVRQAQIDEDRIGYMLGIARRADLFTVEFHHPVGS